MDKMTCYGRGWDGVTSPGIISTRMHPPKLSSPELASPELPPAVLPAVQVVIEQLPEPLVRDVVERHWSQLRKAAQTHNMVTG